MNKNRTCKTCRFWESLGKGEGTCRRNAPIASVPVQDAVGGNRTKFDEFPCWPLTLADEWCGQWEFENGGEEHDH